MDYKKIIKDRSFRIKIMHALSFVPDRVMVKIQYYIKTGRKLNLKDPQRYTEKLQWMKVYYRDSRMVKCADKYDVREYVESCGYENILNELYGIFDSPDEIDFQLLPNSFVIKDTVGSGGNSVLFVYDKATTDIESLKATLRTWTNEPVDVKNPGREWVYDKKRHRILIEKLMIGDSEGDLPDYKFFCFNGEPFCLYMMKNYTQHHDEGILGFLTPDFVLLDAHRKDFSPMLEQPEKPKNYDQMVQIAKKLSAGFPHVRVDMYNLEGKIIFGEMTFFNASGYSLFEPDIFDFEMGEQFILPEANH